MLLHSVFTFLVYQTIVVYADKPSLDDIRSLIVKVREETATVKNSNSDLQNQIGRVQKESIRRIADFNIEKYNLSTEFKEEMDKLKMLQSNLSVLYQEENHIRREANLLQISRQKLELGIKILEEDVAQLESRRKKGEEETCLRLLPTIANAKLRLQRSNLSEEDEMIVLANELEEEKSRLVEATNKKEELQMVLKDKVTLSKTAIENLLSIVKGIDGDLSKAKERVSLLREKYGKKNAEVSSLRENINGDLRTIQDKKGSLNNLRHSMVEFGRAIQCYNRLEEELFHKDY